MFKKKRNVSRVVTCNPISMKSGRLFSKECISTWEFACVRQESESRTVLRKCVGGCGGGVGGVGSCSGGGGKSKSINRL